VKEVNPITKKVARRFVVAAVGVACAFMLIAVVATPAQAGWCLFGNHTKWPKGVAPDYNDNGHICYGYNPRSGTYVYMDDSTGPR